MKKKYYIAPKTEIHNMILHLDLLTKSNPYDNPTGNTEGAEETGLGYDNGAG